MSGQPVIELQDICFGYDTEEVLHNVNFSVHERDLVAVVGPNGGGKSTLLKLILGLERPRRGSITVYGKPPELSRRHIGYVPQYIQFDPDFPVSTLDVVLMGRADRHLAGPYRASDRAAALNALDQVTMKHLRNRPFSELSGGERQRVLIAQALVTEPLLLLLDEPTASVDSVIERKLYDLLKDLNSAITILVVSHNLSVVTRHASHVACVNKTATLCPLTMLSEDHQHAGQATEMTMIMHQNSCHVINPANVLDSPHRAEEHAEDKHE